MRVTFPQITSLLIFLVFSIVMFFLSSCGQEPGTVHSTKHLTMMDDTLLNYNKGVMITEDREIEDFISRYQWKMEKSQTGLRYLIYSHGKGRKAEKGKVATLTYTLKLLNGTFCYSSEIDGPKIFMIGHGGVESGLEEGILLLKVGDRAKFILPSHLAYGLLGDQRKIPQNTSLVYDVTLIEIK
jgi:FKBP-type peptidyl-prolyl cis-trans isomerase FkpA